MSLEEVLDPLNSARFHSYAAHTPASRRTAILPLPAVKSKGRQERKPTPLPYRGIRQLSLKLNVVPDPARKECLMSSHLPDERPRIFILLSPADWYNAE
jgi:hypothetical protein